MTHEVVAAIAEIEQVFVGSAVEIESEPQGGAYVVVHNLDLGERYVPIVTWCGFLVSFQYPYSDVYPHFIDGLVRHADGTGLGPAVQGPMVWRNRSALQVSRRSNRWDPSVDTAATKLAKVIEWIKEQ